MLEEVPAESVTVSVSVWEPEEDGACQVVVPLESEEKYPPVALQAYQKMSLGLGSCAVAARDSVPPATTVLEEAHSESMSGASLL